jgi:hypothetical protein
MRAEKKWPGDKPDLRETPQWGSIEGVWACNRTPGKLNSAGRKYPKDKLKAERKFGCGGCNKKLVIVSNNDSTKTVELQCSGPLFFEEMTIEEVVGQYGERVIFMEEMPNVSGGNNNSGEKKPEITAARSEVVAEGRVEDSQHGN